MLRLKDRAALRLMIMVLGSLMLRDTYEAAQQES
jgi:hypothetical protein